VDVKNGHCREEEQSMIQEALYIIVMVCICFAWYGIGYYDARRDFHKKLDELMHEVLKSDEEGKCDE
jgi:hypothetical protein